jgi:AsmA protein
MAMSRRLRLILLVAGALALTATLVVVVAVYLLLQPDRFTAMLQSQARDTGLELTLASPASPTLFPRPALDLHGITLNARGANAPILLAARGRLALPWRTLFGGPTVITQLQIDAPRVDLDALQAWLNGLPVVPPGTPPNIPRIKTGIRISNGSMVRGNQLLLGNVALEAGSLISGQPTFLRLSAITSSGTPLQMRLSATPSLQGNTLRLDDVVLHLSQGDSAVLDLRGTARWHGEADAVATLAGTLDHAHAGRYAVSLALTPADQVNPLLLALKLDGPDNHADLRLPPLMLARWWNQLGNAQGPQLNMPPGSGHAEFSKIEMGSVSIEGLTLQAGDDVPAAAGTSAPAKPAAAGKP